MPVFGKLLPRNNRNGIGSQRRHTVKKKELEHIEKRLLQERDKALRALGLFDEMAKADRESGDSNLSAYTDHKADQGTVE